VRWYFCFQLSLRDIEEFLVERRDRDLRDDPVLMR
jgi:transposase-like protein